MRKLIAEYRSNHALRRFAMLASLLLCLSVGAFATDAPVIATPGGIDMAAYINATITLIGGIAAVCLGAYFGFKLIHVGVRWANMALDGKGGK